MNLRKLRNILLGVLVLSLVALMGCDNSPSADNPNSFENGGNLSGTLTIAGSTSVQPFSEVLAEEFMANNPDVKINVQGGGSSQGVAAAVSGTADIGAASRDIQDGEKQDEPDLVITRIAVDGVAIIVNPSNAVEDLSMEDVKNIYLGNIINWKEVGGSDAVITVVSREEGSGTRDAFESAVMGNDVIISSAIFMNSNGAVRTTVAGDKNSIGFTSLAVLSDEVKTVAIEGVEPTADNIKTGIYKISRPFNYVTIKEPTGLAKAFIDYVLSDEGQELMVEEGVISIKQHDS